MFNNVYAALNSVLDASMWESIRDLVSVRLSEDSNYTVQEVTDTMDKIISTALNKKFKEEEVKNEKKAERKKIAADIETLFDTNKTLTASEIAKGMGYSVQLISYILREMVKEGVLVADRTSRVIYYNKAE